MFTFFFLVVSLLLTLNCRFSSGFEGVWGSLHVHVASIHQLHATPIHHCGLAGGCCCRAREDKLLHILFGGGDHAR